MIFVLKSKMAGNFAGHLPDLTGQREKIRTSDPYHPKVVRYQAALHAEAWHYNRTTRFDGVFLSSKQIDDFANLAPESGDIDAGSRIDLAD